MAFAAVPVQAQNYKFDLGVNGGGSWYSTSLDDEHLGADREAAFEPGWLLGAQASFWFTPRVALRANGTWSERPFELDGGDDDLLGDVEDANQLVNDVNLWSWTGDLMFRFAEPAETFAGTEFLPYLALGLGMKSIHPALETTTVTTVEGDDEIKGPTFTVGGNTFLLDHQRTLMGLVGIGGDLRLSPNFALRLEAGDRIWDTPTYLLTAAGGLAEDDDIGKTVHEVYGQVGLHMLFGLEEPEQVVVAPAPPMAPAAPQPEVREEAVRVCVIDPTTGEAGIQMVDATYVIESRDTVVTVNGRRVAIDETVSVPVAGETEWFVAGQPLRLNVGPNDNIEFVTYGSSRIIERDLTFVGTVDGLPVYAARADVTALNDQLVNMRGADDLGVWLSENRAFVEDFREVDVVYVPLQPVGCVFQPLQLVEQVRKAK